MGRCPSVAGSWRCVGFRGGRNARLGEFYDGAYADGKKDAFGGGVAERGANRSGRRLVTAPAQPSDPPDPDTVGFRIAA